MLRVAVLGANGRMGHAVVEAVMAAEDLSLCAAVVRSENPLRGRAVSGAEGLDYTADLARALGEADVAVDFTLPEALPRHLDAAAEAATPMVIGTTGLDDAVSAQLRRTADSLALVHAPNMSVGVNLCLGLAELAARALGPDYDVEIVEAHHRHKQDAPSGTAIALGERVAAALGRDLDADAVYGRKGRTGVRRQESIGFSSIRGGGIIGEHTLYFIGDDERIELSHRAQDRAAFASGALRAVRWVADQSPGLYGMGDVLGL